MAPAFRRGTDYMITTDQAIIALRSGKEIGLTRALTTEERLWVAICGAQPTQMLTIHSEGLTRTGMARAWEMLRRRIERSQTSSGRLIYVAKIAA